MKIHLFNNDINDYFFKPSISYLFLSIPQPVNLIEQHRKEVLSFLRFNSKYEKIGRDYYEHLREKYGQTGVIFIGVQVRLTDKAEWLKHVSQGGRMPVPEEILYLMGKAKVILSQYYYKVLSSAVKLLLQKKILM